MTYIGLDKKFSLLVQEAHLIKNTLLSGFDLLLKANFFQDKDGYFYSAFFNISIGMERILKLAVVTNHMLTNNYQTPTIKWLKNTFRHDISILYNDSLKMIPVYLNQQITPTTKAAHDEALIYFFTEYGIGSRYFNLNEVCEAKMDRSPLDKWVDLANSIYNEYTPPHISEYCQVTAAHCGATVP